MRLAFLFQELLEGSPVPGTSKEPPVSSLNNLLSAQRRQRAGGKRHTRQEAPQRGRRLSVRRHREIDANVHVPLSCWFWGVWEGGEVPHILPVGHPGPHSPCCRTRIVGGRSVPARRRARGAAPLPTALLEAAWLGVSSESKTSRPNASKERSRTAPAASRLLFPPRPRHGPAVSQHGAGVLGGPRGCWG